VQGAKMVLFADDTNLLITGNDDVELQYKIKNVIKELEIWFPKYLIINTVKQLLCHFIQNIGVSKTTDNL
jgi:hypothetical protein